MESAEAQPPQYCDIVMKGGIASGVVYPLAAVKLADDHNYSFCNIGGTSAGAIAAAAVAAAEFGLRTGKNPNSYKGIAELPTWLGEELTSLFQPSPRMRPLFRTLLAGIGGGWPSRLIAPMRGFPLATILGCLPGAALIAAALTLHGGLGLRVVTGVIGVIALVVGPYIAALASAAWRLWGLPSHYFGLCPGNDRDGKATKPPLTRWLANLIDELAGRSPQEPLTFGDLRSLPAPDGQEGVNLQMMTTNLSQGRPYSLPFEAGEKFWFDPDEFRDLFPQRIVDHMVGSAAGTIEGPNGQQLHSFPESDELPIVVAARMSLSFPGLICAIPLFAHNDAPKVPSDTPERCWFSDGGITSNFPVHFFDSPIPRWPTFGINLMPLAPDRELSKKECENVWMPANNDEGIAEAWVGWESKSKRKQISAFLTAIFRTAQNWIDNRQMRGAGYRDRIAHVRMAKKEGGMNLKMERKQIERLAERGACAASELAERFAQKPPPGTELTWDNQKWIRYRAYMDLLERRGRAARRGFLDASLGTPLSVMRLAPPSYPWDPPGQGKFPDSHTDPDTDALVAEFEAWEGKEDKFSGNAPTPRTEPWSIPRL
jgi:predicted acylesterase/phospholipase RssA